MSDKCPGCGAADIYNSGFKIECPTKGCSFFSAKQLFVTLGETLEGLDKVSFDIETSKPGDDISPVQDRMMYVTNVSRRSVGYAVNSMMLHPGVTARVLYTPTIQLLLERGEFSVSNITKEDSDYLDVQRDVWDDRTFPWNPGIFRYDVQTLEGSGILRVLSKFSTVERVSSEGNNCRRLGEQHGAPFSATVEAGANGITFQVICYGGRDHDKEDEVIRVEELTVPEGNEVVLNFTEGCVPGF